MPICPKIASGEMEYNIDYGNKTIQLLSDFPADGGTGASFSDELVRFCKINNVLVRVGNILQNSSMSLQVCFSSSSSNNGPMLAAALMHLGVIDSNYRVLRMLV